MTWHDIDTELKKKIEAFKAERLSARRHQHEHQQQEDMDTTSE